MFGVYRDHTDVSNKDKIEVLEVLGAAILLKDEDKKKTALIWERAITMRYTNSFMLCY